MAPTRREPLSLRTIDAVEGRLRPWASPGLLRLVYQLGHRVLRVWWFLTRPRVTGVKVVLRCGDRVLLVRHTYGRRRWELPGGFVRAGEAPEVTMRRELGEELGVTAGAARVIARRPSNRDYKREIRVTFAVDVPEAAVRPNAAEIEQAQWFPHDALPPGTSWFSRQMAARAYWDPSLWEDGE